MSLLGIDVSSHQGKINWQEVKANGINYAILRCHQRYGIDSCFNDNYLGCVRNGIPVGVYKYSYALSVNEAKKEANDVLNVLKDKRISYPVFLDLEDDSQISLGKNSIEKIALAFLDIIAKAGYGVGIYCNANWYKNYISDTLKNKYAFWIASYSSDGSINKSLKPKNAYGWQYSDKGRVKGITGNVDMNLFNLEEDLFTAPIEEEPILIQVGGSIPIFTEGGSSSNIPILHDTTLGSVEIQNENFVTAEDALNVIRGWIGKNEADGSHRSIVDIYNSFSPLPMGYRVSYTDSWCDATVSAVFITLNATDIIGGIECGVERHIAKFKAAGIWIEDGSITPLPGDIITYNWDDNTQPNDGFADHIGLVESVNNGQIITIEGNSSNMVRRNQIPVGYGYIRGFARPKYGLKQVTKNNTIEEEPSVVISNESGKNKFLYAGVVNASSLNVRTWAGTDYDRLKSRPELKKGEVVSVMDYTKLDKNGEPWLYILIDGSIFGFVKAEYISKA